MTCSKCGFKGDRRDDYLGTSIAASVPLLKDGTGAVVRVVATMHLTRKGVAWAGGELCRACLSWALRQVADELEGE